MHALISLSSILIMHSNLKDFVHGQLAAKAEASIIRLSKCIGYLMELQRRFDEGLTTSKPPSDRHVKPKTEKDINLVVKELVSQRAFHIEDERHHGEFRQFKPLLHKINIDKMVEWIDKTTKHILHDQ